MRRKRLHHLVQSAMVLCAAAVGPAAAQGTGGSSVPFEEKELHGDFASDGGCETQLRPNGSPSHFHRAYHFAPDGTWRMVRTFHADKTCNSPLLILRLAGTYSLGQTSPIVAAARAAALSFDLIHVTLQNAKAKPMVAGCGAGAWQVGLEKDVSGTGCPGLEFKPLAECSVDHDIAQIRDGVLYPGVRTSDMCTPEGRPTALQPTGARRVSG